MYLQKCAINKEIRTMSTTISKRCRTNGLSDQWAVGPMGCRTNGLSDHREVTIQEKVAKPYAYIDDLWNAIFTHRLK